MTEPLHLVRDDEHPALERVVGRLRPEFARSVIAAEVLDPIAPYRRCLCCDAASFANGLCSAHDSRWKREGRPDLTSWAEQADPKVIRRITVLGCRQHGCGRSQHAHGLCNAHHQRWSVAGRPEVAEWLHRVIPIRGADPDGPRCLLHGCGFATAGEPGLCDAHRLRWVAAGRPRMERFVTLIESEHRAEDLDLTGLPPLLRAQVQLLLQCRVDEATGTVRRWVLRRFVQILAESEAESFSDRSLDEWLNASHRRSARDELTPALLRDLAGRLELLDASREAEWGRAVWRLSVLGVTSGVGIVSFESIGQPWLRALAQRCVRQRLSTNQICVATAQGYVRGLGRFSAFCAAIAHGPQRIEDLHRNHIEAFLSSEAFSSLAWNTRSQTLNAVRRLLLDIQRYGWAPLHPSAMVHPDDLPRRPEMPSRAIDASTVAQLETDEALGAVPAEDGGRCAMRMLLELGIRQGSLREMPFDCVGADSTGAPIVRYRNTKMKRWRLLPISDALADEIAQQQQRVRERFPAGTPWLFPRLGRNRSGQYRVSSHSVECWLSGWIQSLDLRDASGRLVHITSHQFRHTLGSRMLNANVPQHVVQRWLDHDSPAMTAHYARLTDTTMRKHYEEFRASAVNIRGERVGTASGDAIHDAEWMKERLSRAKETLPDGFCGRPLQKSCPHPNACHTCDDFLTTAEFLPQHRDQLSRTRKLIAVGDANGQMRLVESNRQIEKNLVRIIEALERADDQS